MNELMELTEYERAEVPEIEELEDSKVKCPIEGDEFDTYEKFKAHWDKVHKAKYGDYGEFQQPLTETPLDKERLEAISKKLEDISKDYLQSEEFRETLMLECLNILREMGSPDVETVDFEALKKEAENRLWKKVVVQTSKESLLPQEEIHTTTLRYKNLLSGDAKLLWEMYEGDKTEFLGMQAWVLGKHTGISTCPICRETVFTRVKNEDVTATNLGRKKVELEPLSCLDHLYLAHREDWKRYLKLGEVVKMSFSEYVKSYSNPEQLSTKEELSREDRVLGSVVGERAVLEQLYEDIKETVRGKPKTPKAFRPSEEENKHHDEYLAIALREEVKEELSKTSESKKVPVAKSKIPHSTRKK